MAEDGESAEGVCCRRLGAGRSCHLVLDTDGRGVSSGSGNTGLVRGKEEPDSRRCSATTAGPGQQQHATMQTKRSAVSDMTGRDNIASPPPPPPPPLPPLEIHGTTTVSQAASTRHLSGSVFTLMPAVDRMVWHPARTKHS